MLKVDKWGWNEVYTMFCDEPILNLSSDDASMCIAVNGANKDCFKGKTGLRRAASIYAEQKFDHVEETKSITRKGDGLYEVVATALYEDDDGLYEVVATALYE